MNVAEVENALLALTDDERARVIKVGLRSLDSSEYDEESDTVEALWREEIRDRVQSIQDGTAKLVPHGEVMRRVREARKR